MGLVKLTALKFGWWQRGTLKFIAATRDIFSPKAKISTVQRFLTMVVIHHWSLHQLDIKNIFLHGELEQQFYIQLGFVL